MTVTIEYQPVAFVTSLASIALYGLLTLIAFRRARRTSHHEIVVEGPAISIGMLVSVLTLLSAITLASPSAQDVVVLSVAAIRGAIIAAGAWLLTYFWVVRDTWL